MHRPLQRAAFGALLLAGSLTGATVARLNGGFTAYVPPVYPRVALGDFDGDGRRDVALIQGRQDGTGDSVLQVTLSGSPGAAVLKTTIISVVTADIDHDGDLDLVAVAPSGNLVIWINDGLGHYTLQEALHGHEDLSSEPTVVQFAIDQPVALGVTAPLVASRGRSATAIVVTQMRPPTLPLTFSLSFLSLPALRAPPLPTPLA
jgi:hypothetical protein